MLDSTPLVLAPTSRKKRRAQPLLAARCASCLALASLLGAAHATGCGSSTDLIIGRNSPVAGGGNSGNAGAAVAGNGGLPATDGGAAGQAGVSSEAGAIDCGDAGPPPVESLLHRYSFEGTGSVAKDSVGLADGELLSIGQDGTPMEGGTGAVLDGSGLLVLDGESGYVNLPNRLISSLTEVSIVAWVQWNGGAGFQRIFDFGVGAGEDDTSSQGRSYLAATPAGLTGTRLQILARGAANSGEIKTLSEVDLKGQMHQVAVVFVSSSYAELYSDGVQAGHSDASFPLSAIDDLNVWIGRSQWTSDHTFDGTVDEFRIYGRALSACEVAALNAAGPNATR